MAGDCSGDGSASASTVDDGDGAGEKVTIFVGGEVSAPESILQVAVEERK